MKISRLLLLLPFALLTSCNKGYGPSIVCPTGAPALVFYDQGNNSNFVTLSDAKQIVAQFQNNAYDAIVIDATNGLEQIKQHPNTKFRFAKLLTAGNLYLVSYKETTDPTTSSTILSFGNVNSIPRLVSEQLNKTWKSTIEYKDSVKDVLTSALASDEYQYYLLAEPALTALKNKKPNIKYVKSYKELLGSDIPQAALFINKDKKNEFKDYFVDLNKRIDNCINDSSKIKSALDKYSKDDADINTRFGFQNSAIVEKIQNGQGGSGVKNGFAIYPSNEKYTYNDINTFLKKVGSQTTYPEDYFIDVNN